MSRYEFDTTDTSQESLPVIISEGKYKGMKYRYGSVQFKEEDNEMKMSFDYDIIDNVTDRSIGELDEDEDFTTLLGDLLLEILNDELGKGEDFLRETDDD
tara:strand:- start:384 stop:683 length:300 start_codon:yes stop_codon:yes gene_type:complete